MDPETRESLIARLPDHADSAAWNEFVEIYEPLIFGIARRHGLQPTDAGDLVQNVLFAVAGSIQRFEFDPAQGRFRSWLFRVARNQALVQIRQLKRDVSGTGDSAVRDILAAEPSPEASDTEFDSAFRRRVFRWAARRVRETVQPKTWDAFARTAINGEPPQSVAEELGVDVGAVYLCRSRVMSRLRRMVEGVSVDSLAALGDSAETAS